MQALIDFMLHIDDHLVRISIEYGAWTYAILFGIIFCETGLVVMPFLPGDSLLFAAGAVAKKSESYSACAMVVGLTANASSPKPLSVSLLMGLLFVAAVLGDTVNYHIGRFLGPKVLSGKLSRWLNPKHLEKTQQFFASYGAKTIVIARFVPIIRTFAPFVAGVGQMDYRKFLLYNVVGGAVWVLSMTLAGYWFGGLELVQKYFELVVVGIVFVSLLPAVFEFLRHWYLARAAAAAEKSAT